jgi:exosortase
MPTRPLADLVQAAATPRNVGFVALIVATVVAFAAPLTRLTHLALQYEHYSHIVLIPAISGFLLVRDRPRIFAHVATGGREGVAVLGGGVLLTLVAHRSLASASENDRLSLTIVAAVVMVLGAFVLCYGRAAFRAGLFPLLFLFWMVPVPDLLLDRVIVWLQTWSAEVSYAAFDLLGIPVLRQGLVFSLPGVTIEVARECSGIRSSLALLITSLLMGQLFLRSVWAKSVVVLVAIPLLVIKNGIRIVTLSLLAIYVDPSFLSGSLHRQGGVVFFLTALALLLPVLWVLERTEQRPPHRAAV